MTKIKEEKRSDFSQYRKGYTAGYSVAEQRFSVLLDQAIQVIEKLKEEYRGV